MEGVIEVMLTFRILALSHARPVKCNDFHVDARLRTVTVISNGYSSLSRSYTGGAVETLSGAGVLDGRRAKVYITNKQTCSLAMNGF